MRMRICEWLCVCVPVCMCVCVRECACVCVLCVCVCVRAERQLMGGASPDQQTEGGLSSALSIVRRA